MKIRPKKFNELSLKTIDPVIRILIFSDMLIIGAMGMFGPLYAIFVEDFIVDASEIVVAVSISIYLISRSILQIPIATLLDRIKGEKDDYYLMVISSFLVGVLHLFFLFIDQAWQLFLLQALIGIFTAVTYPSFCAIFTRHIDPHFEATEWGVYQTFVDLTSAATASIGGYIAEIYGFPPLVVTVAIICMLGSLVMIPLKNNIIYKKTS